MVNHLKVIRKNTASCTEISQLNTCQINIHGGLTIKATNSWLGYKTSKAKTYAMDVLYKDKKLLHYKRLKSHKYTTVVFAMVSFNDLKALKGRINGHDNDLDGLDRYLKTFLEKINQ